jgi:polar amino acid transport system substrate-binding protein
VLLRTALARLRREHRGTAPLRLIPAAIDRCYDGLEATLVNIVKAVALASTIGVPEIVSAVNAILAEGADAAPMMNLLLVFYFLFDLAVLLALRAGRSAVRRLAWMA